MSTLTYAEAGVIGLLQGVTELFPISSLGHAVLVPAIRPPSVPEGTSRLRIGLTAGHTEADIGQLEAALQGVQERAPAPSNP